MTREKAEQAIAEPAKTVGVSFDADALDRLVWNLSRVVIEGPNGPKKHRGLYVEPVQLQIVCTRLWGKLAERGALDDLRIEKHEVEDVVGEVDNALGSYYDERVRDAALASGVDERAIRDWVAQQFIGTGGIRTQVQEGPASTEGDRLQALKALQDAFLIRSEKRHGADWYGSPTIASSDPFRRTTPTGRRHICGRCSYARSIRSRTGTIVSC